MENVLKKINFLLQLKGLTLKDLYLSCDYESGLGNV